MMDQADRDELLIRVHERLGNVADTVGEIKADLVPRAEIEQRFASAQNRDAWTRRAVLALGAAGLTIAGWFGWPSPPS